MRFFFFTILIFFKGLVFSQEKTFVNIQQFSEKQGLSSPNVRKIIKDKYGFIWVATQDGLNKFDGNSFLIFNSNQEDKRRRSLGNDFTDIAIDSTQEIIWSLNSNGGINKIDVTTNEIIYGIRLPENPGNINPTNIIVQSGSIIITTNTDIIYIKENSNSTSFTEFKVNEPLEQGEEIQKCVCIEKNRLLLGTNHGNFFILDTESKKSFACQLKGFQIAGKIKIHSTYKDQDKLLIATSAGLLVINNCAAKIPVIEKYLDGDIYSITASETGYIYAIANKLLTIDKGSFAIREYVQAGNPLNHDPFFDLYAIALFDNSLFLGGSKYLSVISNITSSFTKYFQPALPSEKSLGHLSFIDLQNDSLIRFCATTGIGALNFNTNEIKWFANDQEYYNFFKLSEREIVASGEKQNIIIDLVTNKKRELPSALSFLKGDFIIASKVVPTNEVYFATYKTHGLYKLKVKSNGEYVVLDLNKDRVDKQFIKVNNILLVNDSVIFICDKALVIYNAKSETITLHKIKNAKFPDGISTMMDICEIKGSYYLAAYGYGIVELDKKFNFISCVTDTKKLQSNGFYKIFKAGDSLLLASSNNGLVAYNVYTGQLITFSENDGIHSSIFEEFSGTIYNKTLCFGGVNGITKINLGTIRSYTKKPKIYFLRAVLKAGVNSTDTYNINFKKLTVANNVSVVNINFTVIDFENPGHFEFEYKIEEISKEWYSNGDKSEIQLIGLEPGIYHFQIRVINSKGVKSDPLLLTLDFEPKWYQTWWFKLLILLIIAGIIYAFYRYRIRQIEKQHAIRKNIATDLHDDLGSTLNSVKVFTNLAISGIKQEESLQQVKDNLTEATMSLRDMIWVLDDSLDTVDELVTRIKQFAIPVSTASNIEATIKADSEVNNRQLTKEEKRNLFLICKEAINNSIKYSGANQINVTISASGKKIQIQVVDNGKGFNVDEVKKGYGLKNMQYRAGQIKYVVELVSEVGNGTRVKVLPV